MSEIQFPVVQKNGGSALWTVTPAQLRDWQTDFPHLDIVAEVRKARSWCVANLSRRKTARGMPRFLVGWLMRAEGTGTLERRVAQRRADFRQEPTYTVWTCPHTPPCPHRLACKIVTARTA